MKIEFEIGDEIWLEGVGSTRARISKINQKGVTVTDSEGQTFHIGCRIIEPTGRAIQDATLVNFP